MENATGIKAAPAAAQTCASAMKGINRKPVYIGFGVAAAAGLVFGWNWLVAVGLSSIIIGVLPCLLMCAFGVCASRMGQKKTESATTSSPSSPDVPLAKAAVEAEESAPARESRT